MSIRISPFLLPEKRIEKVLLVYLLDHFLYLFLFTVILATFADTQQSIHFMTLVQVLSTKEQSSKYWIRVL